MKTKNLEKNERQMGIEPMAFCTFTLVGWSTTEPFIWRTGSLNWVMTHGLYYTVTWMRRHMCHACTDGLTVLRSHSEISFYWSPFITNNDNNNNINNKVLSFVSQCSHMWWGSWTLNFNCMLLVFVRWMRLFGFYDLIKHSALLWLVGFCGESCTTNKWHDTETVALSLLWSILKAT